MHINNSHIYHVKHIQDNMDQVYNNHHNIFPYNNPDSMVLRNIPIHRDNTRLRVFYGTFQIQRRNLFS